MRGIPEFRYGRLFYAPSRNVMAHCRMALILYQRDDCHLCDRALEVLAAARVPELEHVWIDADAQLEASYGLRVPVLRDSLSGAELDWPFDVAAVRRFLADSA